MNLVIEQEAAASPKITPLDFGCEPRSSGCDPNPAAWMLTAYERYLEIEIDMRWYGPHIVTVKREIQEVAVIDEGTDREALNWRTYRIETRHYLDAIELGEAWPEMELRKQDGMLITVHHQPQLLKHA